MSDTMTIRDVLDGARDEAREAIAWDPADMVDLDTLGADNQLSETFTDRAHEIADSAVPIYNHDRAACLADDPSLAYVDDPGLLGDEPDVWSILGVAIYERAHAAAYEHAAEVIEFAGDFAHGYLAALVWSERPDTLDDDADRSDAEVTDDDREAWGETDGDETIDSDALEEIKIDAVRFVCENWRTLDYASVVRDAESLGHDYALTRNGHGTGYWDRDEITTRLVHGIRGFERYADDPTRSVGGILADAARDAGAVALYSGDDGTLHYMRNA